MKKGIITLLAILLISMATRAQSPEQMSYQAVIRDASEKLISNKAVGMRISILQGSENGAVVYQETQTPVSNVNGLVSIQIGKGESDYSFSDIHWNEGPYFLKSEVDTEGGINYTIAGTSQLLSVPFALYSTTAENVANEKQTLTDVIENMNFANSQIKDVDNPTDPHDAVNKEYVTLRISTSGDTLFMGDQFVVIPNISSANVKVPEVITIKPDDISISSATFLGEIKDNNWDKIKAYGFIYSEEEGFENSTGTKITLDAGIEKGVFSVEQNNLEVNRTYYYRAFATNDQGTSYGAEESFTTFDMVLSLTPVSTQISDVIGRGYDITGKYANSFSLKSSVLDYNKLKGDSIVHRDLNQNSGAILSSSGSTLSHYQSNLSVFAEVSGKYGCFSGEISTHFAEERTSSSSFSYATISSKQIKSAYCIDNDVRFDMERLRSYLRPEFKNDVNNLTPVEIFNKYGTDVLLGGMWGGRADFNMSAQKTAKSNGSSVGVYAEAKYNSIFVNAEANVDVDSKYKSDFETSNTNSAVTSRGGVPSVISTLADMKTWQESITDDNQVFMEFYDGCVIPISEFIEDENKKADLAYARDTLIKSKGFHTNETPSYEAVSLDLGKSAFTSLRSGDKDVYSKDGRQTGVSLSFTLSKTGANVITCVVSLKVKEIHSDNTTYSGTYSKKLTLEKEVLDFPQKHYSLNTMINGSYHKYYDLKHVNDCDWLSNLSVLIDSNSDDQKAIGVLGTVNITLPFRNTLWDN